MKINRNMSAVITNNQLKRTENNLAASMERLSSGLKINSAGDNPAGMAISNKMKAQIDALDKAESNATDAISTLQIADGALNEVSSILQRMRELSVQAANGTNSSEDRNAIQEEIEALRDEVDRISTDTEYNQKNLLDGSSDVRVYGDQISRLYVSDTVTSGIYNLHVTETGEKPDITFQIPLGQSGEIGVYGETMNVKEDMTADEFFAAFLKTAEAAGCDVERDGNQVTLTSSAYGSSSEIELNVSGNLSGVINASDYADMSYDEEKDVYTYTDHGKDAVVEVSDQAEDNGFTSTTTISADGNRVIVTDRNGFSIDFLLDADYPQDSELELEVTDIGPMTIQVGANEYQTVEIRIPEISAESLYLDTVNVGSENGASKAISTLDEAIAKLNSVRSGIGAYQNQLEHASASLAETQEDVTRAYSNLLDTDMAEEMTEYTQQNVLDQAAISVLAQANDLPAQVLSLLSK